MSKFSNYLLFFVTQIFVCQVLLAQSNIRLTQYTETLSLYNPAFSGLENHTDIRFGIRTQWSNIDNAPISFYTNISGTLPEFKKRKTRTKKYKSPYNINQLVDGVQPPNNGLRTSNPHLYKLLVRDSIIAAVKKLDRKGRLDLRRQLRAKDKIRYKAKHGYSTNLMAQENGAITQFSWNLGYAYHLPVAQNLMLSMGLSTSLLNSQFDSNKAKVANPFDDPLYQQYASGNMDDYIVFVNSGINLYNDRFYASYAINRILKEGLSDNAFLSGQNIETIHNMAIGTSFNLNSNFSVQSSFLFTIKEVSPFTTIISAKTFYQDKLWLGIHYSLKDAAAVSFGFYFADQYKFSYAYEVPEMSDQNQLGITNEIMLGILINKGAAPNPFIQ